MQNFLSRFWGCRYRPAGVDMMHKGYSRAVIDRMRGSESEWGDGVTLVAIPEAERR